MMSLGKKLRDARIEKGYTLNTLQQMTKIQKKYLQAIEDEQFEAIPGDFYARAFIKQYADVVDLDSSELLAEYEAADYYAENDDPDYEPVPSQDATVSRTERYKSAEKDALDVALSYLPLALLIGIILIVMITLLMTINNLNRANEAESSQESIATVSLVELESSEPSESVGSIESQPESPEETANTELAENQLRVGQQVLTQLDPEPSAMVYQYESANDDYQIEVEASGYVWITVLQDDEVIIDQAYNEGDIIELKLDESASKLEIRRGYPEGAQFKVNGVEVAQPAGEWIDRVILYANDSQSGLAPATTNQVQTPPATEEPTTTENQEASSYEGPAVFAPGNDNE